MTRILLLALAAIAFAPVGSTHAAVAVVEAGDSRTEMMQRARQAAAAGRHGEAIALYDALLAASPTDDDARLARGRTYGWMSRWAESEADLSAVTVTSPTYADAWLALGDMYLRSGRPAEALVAYDRLQALRPDDADPLLARAKAHRALGSAAAAKSDIDAAVARGAVRPAHDDALSTTAQRPLAASAELLGAGYRWSLQAEARHTDFSGDRANWQEHAMVLRRRFARGSLGLELLQAQRFGRGDSAVALDAYVDTWHRGYANLRYQDSGGDGLLPDAWRVELFQGVGRGWELSAGVDQLRFPSSSTDIYSVGVGRYAGNFYIRARTRYVGSSGSLSHQATVRWYYAGDADSYLEGSAGTGRGEEAFRGLLIEENSRTLGVSWMTYLTPRVGLKLGARHVDGIVDETVLSAAAYLRW